MLFNKNTIFTKSGTWKQTDCAYCLVCCVIGHSKNSWLTDSSFGPTFFTPLELVHLIRVLRFQSSHAFCYDLNVLPLCRLSGVSPFNGDTEEDTFANIKLVRYDANALYHNVTKFSMKFIYQTLKRSPRSVTQFSTHFVVACLLWPQQARSMQAEAFRRPSV